MVPNTFSYTPRPAYPYPPHKREVHPACKVPPYRPSEQADAEQRHAPGLERVAVLSEN